MFRTILPELFLPFRPFKKTANIRWATISAKVLHKRQTKWWVAPKRKTGEAAKHLYKQTADCTALQSQIDWTIEPLNEKSQIAQEYGLLPAKGGNFIYPMMHRFILYYQASEHTWSYQFNRDVTVEQRWKATCFADKTFCTFAVSIYLRFSFYYSKYNSC